MKMKYIVRAIIYYPLLITICLFFEIIMGFYLLCGLIWHFENKDKETYGFFIKYFELFSSRYYKEFIKGGVRLITIKLI